MTDKKPRHRRRELAPATVLVLYYAVSIVAGTTLLHLPWASTGTPLGWLDALFTATSAQCVTGLAVVDTGQRLSLFGQGVLLVLIQTGGLGITTFSVYLFFYVRQRVGLRGRWFIQSTLLHTPVDSLQALIRSIFLMTLCIEGAGTLLLALRFVPEMGWGWGLYTALFHAISAFCNAGFSLFSDSLVRYRGDLLVNGTIMALIVLGGIGFLVLDELWHHARQRQGRHKLTLHTRLVLITTTVLIVGGTLVILQLERHASLQGMGWGEGLLTSLFQSVTARTAGFNTIDLNRYEVPTLFWMMALMFIGASPGSSGGGVKTTSLAVFFAVLDSRLRGQNHTAILRRNIPEETATKAMSLMMLAGVVLFASILLLLSVQLEGRSVLDSGHAFVDYTFEAVSAFGTVGLSLGATARLTAAGKGVIILLMFIGRVGLLTLAFAILHRARKNPVVYSEENIMIG